MIDGIRTAERAHRLRSDARRVHSSRPCSSRAPSLGVRGVQREVCGPHCSRHHHDTCVREQHTVGAMCQCPVIPSSEEPRRIAGQTSFWMMRFRDLAKCETSVDKEGDDPNVGTDDTRCGCHSVV